MGESNTPALGDETILTAVASEAVGALLDRSGQQLLVQELVRQARGTRADLVGSDSLLAGLKKLVLEAALEAEMVEHLGYDPASKNGESSRDGRRSKAVLTVLGPVEIELRRDREGTFASVIVKMPQRRLDSVDDMVLSLIAKGLTTGEVSAHF